MGRWVDVCGKCVVFVCVLSVLAAVGTNFKTLAKELFEKFKQCAPPVSYVSINLKQIRGALGSRYPLQIETDRGYTRLYVPTKYV